MGIFALAGGLVASAVVGALGQASAANKAAKAAAQARKDAAAQAAANERAVNEANQKKPNIFAISSANAMQNSSGVGATLLTGPGGVAADNLMLGRNTLLGQ